CRGQVSQTPGSAPTRASTTPSARSKLRCQGCSIKSVSFKPPSAQDCPLTGFSSASCNPRREGDSGRNSRDETTSRVAAGACCHAHFRGLHKQRECTDQPAGT